MTMADFSQFSPALALRGIDKSYGKERVIRNVSFELAKGEIAALLGPSGCGKTTTLRSIAGFVQPNAGTVSINGRDVTSKPPFERDFGILFQDYALFPHLTVAENVAYGLKHRNYKEKAHSDRVGEMLALVRMQSFSARYPSQLSGGQKQRVALARALAPNPAILLLDEPLSALDASVRGELQAELKQLLRDVGITSVVVTHDHEEAAVLADKVLLMDKGEIVQSGPPIDMYDRPQSQFAAEFLGDVNWLHAGLLDVSGTAARLRLSNGQILKVQVANGNQALLGGDVLIGIRPERLTLGPASGSENSLQGTVESVINGRVHLQMTVALGNGSSLKVVHRRNGALPAAGQPVELVFGLEDAFVLPAKALSKAA
jgi:putative spermidine/putrescine transport system ATP-binding protein/putrescine transport system ATP-binding protein